MIAYKTPPKYFKYFLFLRNKIHYSARTFTIQLFKSIGPNGELRLKKNTPIMLPTNPSKGKRTHIPKINSATGIVIQEN